MQTLYVQFSDSTEATIVSVWTVAQDPAVYPNQGVIQSNDARYKTWYASIPAGPSRLGLVVPGS